MYRVDLNGRVPVMDQVDRVLRGQEGYLGLKRIPFASGQDPIRRPRDKSIPRCTR